MKTMFGVVVSLMVFLSLPGCSTTSLFSKWTHRGANPKATAANPAVRILCMWQPADGVGVDEKPARGVAAQIFFFTQNSVTPVEVAGDVRIFLFDDQGPEEQQGTALHEFDFVKGAWNAYLINTQFGPAYQLFVPYSRKGHHQAELAVRIRLTPSNGPVIFSDMAAISLPGYDSKHAAPKDSVATSEATGFTGGQLAVGQAAADSPTEITPERIQEAYLQVLAERTKSSAPAPSGRQARTKSSERPAPQMDSSTRTTSSVVGRLQVHSNGHNVIALQEDYGDEQATDDNLAEDTADGR